MLARRQDASVGSAAAEIAQAVERAFEQTGVGRRQPSRKDLAGLRRQLEAQAGWDSDADSALTKEEVLVAFQSGLEMALSSGDYRPRK